MTGLVNNVQATTAADVRYADRTSKTTVPIGSDSQRTPLVPVGERIYFPKKGDSKAQKKVYEQALILKYVEEQGFSEKDAKKLAKWQAENMAAEDKVRNTIVCWTKEEYETAKRENPNMNVTMPNDKIRKIVMDNPERFFDENMKFSSDKYKETLFPYIGADYKLNLDERKLVKESFTSENVRTSGRNAVKIAQTGGYQTEKDLTMLYRTAAVLGSAGLGALGGALMGHTVSLSVVQSVLEECCGASINQIVKGGKSYSHVLEGAGLGALIGTVASLAIKDNGGKCIFQASDIEHIIRDPERGLRNVTNSTHKEVLKAIIDDKSLTDDEKIQFVKEAYGEWSGKKVNARELVAAYTGIIEGRKPNREIECPEQECPECPETPEVPATPEKPPVQETPPVDETPEEIPTVADCPVRLRDETNVTETEVPTCKYTPEKGEYWFSIVQAKYETTSFKDTMDIVHQLKRAHGITDFRQNVQPKVMHLPEIIILASGDEKKLKCENDNIVRTDKFAPAVKYTGTYTPKVIRQEDTKYYFIDCKDKESERYNSTEERARVIEENNLRVVNE